MIAMIVIIVMIATIIIIFTIAMIVGKVMIVMIVITSEWKHDVRLVMTVAEVT